MTGRRASRTSGSSGGQSRRTGKSHRRAYFGGSFDPVHVGHLILAELICDLEKLDQVVFVPAQRSPHKNQTGATPEQRLRMLQLALRGNPRLTWDAVELERPAPSYTIDTVRHFARRYGSSPLLIIGGDSLLDLHSWKDSQSLLREARIIVFGRPEATHAARLARKLGLSYHEVALTSISSSWIRQRLSRGLSIRYLVSDPVRRYIEAQRLYRGRQRSRRQT